MVAALFEKGVREESILAAMPIASVIDALAGVPEAKKASAPAAVLT